MTIHTTFKTFFHSAKTMGVWIHIPLSNDLIQLWYVFCIQQSEEGWRMMGR